MSLIFRSAKASFVVPSSFFDEGISLLISSSRWIFDAKNPKNAKTAIIDSQQAAR